MKLIKMNEIQAEKVSWLWYPYIPFGKITLVQGDPGDGKTTFVLADFKYYLNNSSLKTASRHCFGALCIQIIPIVITKSN